MSDPTARRPTIYDVAERAGVSKSLVSLVLRNSPQVSQQRRAAVLDAIAALDYRPSQAATMLASTRSRHIEVLIDEYRNLSFVGLVDGIRDALSAESLHLTVTELQQRDGVPATMGTPTSAATARILAAEPTAAVLAGWSNLPTVVAGHRLSVPAGADVVANDDHRGGELAAQHLIALGHRRIGHLTGSGGSARLREEGFTAAVESAGLRLLLAGRDGGTTEQDGYRSAYEILRQQPDVTALAAANDLMAVGALAAARDHGRTVPAELSVIGYDNSPLAQSRYLALTTIDDRSAEVGAAAARALLQRIDDPTAVAVHSLVEPTLINRRTTAPV